jgi:hypothetical protein
MLAKIVENWQWLVTLKPVNFSLAAAGFVTHNNFKDF